MTPRVTSFARIGFLSLICLFAGTAVMAQDFWAKKEFNQWSDEELRKFLTDSPWVKRIEVPRSDGPDATNFVNLTIAWESSLPVRWANARTKMGKPGDVPEELKAGLEQSPNAYIIRISGLPADIVPALQANPKASDGSTLKVGKKTIPISKFGWAAAAPAPAGAGRSAAPRPAADAGGGGGRGGRGGGGGVVPPADAGASAQAEGGRGNARPGTDFFMIFSTQDPIKLEDGDNVEVSTRLAFFKIQKAFKLKDMVVNGKLLL